MTDTSSAQLLNLLASGIRPARPGGASPTGPVSGRSFADMLRNVDAGKVASGLGVSVARGVEVPLSREQMDRLAVAADAAQARGSSRALVLIDGMALRMDVLSRRITGVVDVAAGGVFDGFDSVISAGTPTEPEPAAGPGGAGDNASLLRLLSEVVTKRAG